VAAGQKVPERPEGMDLQEWADSRYPSATTCAPCHPRQFEEWSYSSHAYASMSPMFNKFEQAINNLAQGTTNYFCLRCHASVATALGDQRDLALWERSKAANEGITCVTCHRVGEAYGKVNGERRINPGDIHETVQGPFDHDGVSEVVRDARKWRVTLKNQEDREGWVRIHPDAIQSEALSQSEFCVACHQVQVHPGIKLETVWEEYRASPAAAEAITCQDCHMSTKPGQNSGYATGSAARIHEYHPNPGTVRDDRRASDHSFIGPGYPISHPGLFPLSANPPEFTAQEWLKFDYRAGWGSEEFESQQAGSDGFPPEWQDRAHREKAWGIVQKNLDRWKFRLERRLDLMENSSRVDGPFFDGRLEVGKPLKFKFKITNLNKGHNMPSGSLGAQPQLWLNVALTDPDGHRIWESGYLDSRGDLADIHSLDVAAGTVEFDPQLVNLQAKFITTNLKGTDREMYLPVSFEGDQLPFIRPGNVPVSLLNHPPGVRMEKRSIPPLGSRFAEYKVPAELIDKPGTYRLAVRLRSRSEPIYFMEFVGSTTDMKRAMNEWITDVHPYAVEFDVR
jgi:nitrate/TMAO reductase-like tetraheme cytochrome c subunit